MSTKYTPAMCVGLAVFIAREDKRLTKSDLALLVGVRKATISRIENGKSVSIGVLLQIAYVLGMSPKTFMPTKKTNKEAMEYADGTA